MRRDKVGRPVKFEMAPGKWYRLVFVNGKLKIIQARGFSTEHITVAQVHNDVVVFYPPRGHKTASFPLKRQDTRSDETSAQVVLDVGLSLIVVQFFHRINHLRDSKK